MHYPHTGKLGRIVCGDRVVVAGERACAVTMPASGHAPVVADSKKV